jgi:hypothetical protein
MEFKSQDSWKEAMQAVPTNTLIARGKVPPQKGVGGKRKGKKQCTSLVSRRGIKWEDFQIRTRSGQKGRAASEREMK